MFCVKTKSDDQSNLNVKATFSSQCGGEAVCVLTCVFGSQRTCWHILGTDCFSFIVSGFYTDD